MVNYVLLWWPSWILYPSMEVILDTILLWRSSWILCPSMEAILAWILCPSMEIILDTMSFCGGHLGFSISPKITHFVKNHSNVIHNKFNFNERWQQIQNFDYQTWYFLKGILEFEEHFLIHRCFWKVKNEIVYRSWHYVYISNNLLNSTQVIEWKPNVGCTWIKHTIPGLYV